MPVLIFQHNPIAVNGGAMQGVISSGSTLTTFATSSASRGVTLDMYNTITANADIIKGIFCGYHQGYFYGEITGTGTGEAAGKTIPQFAFMSNALDGGYALKINVK